MAEQYSTRHGYYLLICSWTDGHLGGFRILAIFNDVAEGCIDLFKLVFSLLSEKYPDGVAGSYF